MTRLASPEDFEVCRRLHQKHGTTYYLASRRFPVDVRRRVDALYGFVRVPDEFVDNPDPGEEPARLIAGFRQETLAGLAGARPESPVLRAFVDVANESGIGPEEPTLFLDAMAADLTVRRYPTYADLRAYMRGSAVAVGLMMCRILDAPADPETDRAATALGEAMQMTNFLRDVAEDWRRGRIYLPLEDLERFGVREADIAAGEATEAFLKLMAFEIARTRALYAEADQGIPLLPPRARKAVRLARVLYAGILERIEAQGCDVFRGRARTTRLEKAVALARVGLFG